MATRAGNPVARDIMTNPEVVLLFHGERGPRRDRMLRVRGRAVFRTEPPHGASVPRGGAHYLARRPVGHHQTSAGLASGTGITRSVRAAGPHRVTQAQFLKVL
jgi:hypothetical protein